MVHIYQLARPCLTRRRGEEAYQSLQKLLGPTPIEIDLNNAELLSMSFLDGLILKLLNAKEVDRVTFVVDEDPVIKKLCRISEIRELPLYFRNSASREREILQSLVSSL